MNSFVHALKANLGKIRLRRPVVHHITNFVTINDCANATAALGASPVMAFCPAEAAEITLASRALVLNLGTPDEKRFKAAELSSKAAAANKIPIVLDPVGIGASKFRLNEAAKILSLARPSIIKGNIAEIKVLAGAAIGTNKCIDSAEKDIDIQILKELSLQMEAVVAATGEKDIITNGARTAFIERGTPLFAAISGSGCMAASVAAAFSAVEKDAFWAAVQALYAVNVCGEQAAAASKGPADFKINFINALYNLEKGEIEEEGIFFEQE